MAFPLFNTGILSFLLLSWVSFSTRFLHSLSFLRLIYPFSDSLVCNFCIPGFVSFQDRSNFFYILAWPRNGEDRERVVCSAPYRSLSFSLRTLPSSFAVAWNIKFPIRVCKLRTSFQEITSLFKGKRQRKKNIDESCLNDWETAYGCFCFFFSVWCGSMPSGGKGLKKLLQPDTRKIL